MILKSDIAFAAYFGYWLGKLGGELQKEEISITDSQNLLLELLLGKDEEALQALHQLRKMFNDDINSLNELENQGYDNDQITWN